MDFKEHVISIIDFYLKKDPELSSVWILSLQQWVLEGSESATADDDWLPPTSSRQKEPISVISRLSSSLSARISDVTFKEYYKRAEDMQLMTLLTAALTVQMVILIYACTGLRMFFWIGTCAWKCYPGAARWWWLMTLWWTHETHVNWWNFCGRWYRCGTQTECCFLQNTHIKSTWTK